MRRGGSALLAFALLCSATASAGDAEAKTDAKACQPVVVDTDYPVSGEAMMSQCGRKFVRGLANVLTGAGEIPRQTAIFYKDSGSAASIPAGFFTGIFMTVARTAYGGVEAATFIAPLEGSYDSLLKPDYVWGPIESKAKKPAPKEVPK